MNALNQYVSKLSSLAAALLKYLCTAAVYTVVKYFFFFFASGFTPDEREFWKIVLFIGAYVSTAYAFAVYNKNQCLKFLKSNSRDVFKELLSFDFFVDQIFAVIFFLVFSIELVSVTAIAAAIISNIGLYVYARSLWLQKAGSKEPAFIFSVKLAVHVLLSFPGLFILFFLISSFIPSLPTLLMVARLVSYMLIIPALLTVFLYIRALNKMQSFLNKLKKFCKDNKIKEPVIKSPYLSVFINRPENIFEIELHGQIYACSLLSFTNIFRPVIFKSDGYFYRISARALKRKENPLFFLESSFCYDSDRPKLVIITSVPYVVKLQEGTLSKTFDTGDICGGYKLFTPMGFFGAAERNTIGRKTFD